MLSDDQLVDRLRARLADEVAHVHPAPDLVRTLRRRHARRVVAGRVAMATPVVAAAVATGMVTTGTVPTGTVPTGTAGVGGRHAPPPAAGSSPTRSNQPLRDVAYVSARAQAALANLSDYVLRSRLAPVKGYRDVDTIDMRTGRSRFDSYGPHGPLNSIAVSGAVVTGSTVLVVDYPSRSWWTYRLAPPPLGRGIQVSPMQDPAQIRDAIADGSLEVLGEQPLDGHDTLHLRLTRLPRQLPASLELWVDAQTYLPYRLTSGKSGRTSTVDYEWLPRTGANLSSLDLTPPAGFTHRARPVEPDASGPGQG